MNRRLEQFLAAENISQSAFADSIGVARASVSHILAGRNKPGFDFIENMSRRYPTLNLEWLITGKGKMYKETQSKVQSDVFSGSLFAQSDLSPLITPDNSQEDHRSSSGTNTESAETPENIFDTAASSHSEKQEGKILVHETESSAFSEPLKTHSTDKTISKIIVFYSDNSFLELK